MDVKTLQTVRTHVAESKKKWEPLSSANSALSMLLTYLDSEIEKAKSV